MSAPQTPDPAQLQRYRDADVIFVAQDGFSLAPARVRCYSFAKLLCRNGIAAEVLSFVDHLGARFGGGPVAQIPEDEKLRLNLRAYDILSQNPRAVLYVQKAGYHVVACCLAAARNGNPIVFDYDDYDVGSAPYGQLEPWFPSLNPEALLATMARRADACVVSSTRLRDLVARHRPDVHLVHTVADLEVFNTAGRTRPRHRFGDAVNILWCGDVWGALILRDIFFALDAFALVPPAVRARARFHLIGFGRAWPELKERAARRYAGVDGIVFHERIAPERFGEVLAEMDIGVLPYADTMFNACKSPTKMFEYLLTKVAVCSTPVGEVVHCLEDGTSVLLADGLEAYAAALSRLIADDALRNGVADAAYERGVRDFTLQGIGERLTGILRPLLGGRGREPAGPGVGEFLAGALGRTQPISQREVEIALNDLRTVLRAKDPAAVESMRWTAPLMALLDWPGLARAEGVTPQQRDGVKAVAAHRRNAAEIRKALAFAAAPHPAEPPSPSKLAAAEDWESPSWYAWMDRFKESTATFPRFVEGEVGDAAAVNAAERRDLVYNFFKRSRGAWTRVQAAYALDRLGCLGEQRAGAIVAPVPDGLPLFLSRFLGRVDTIDIGDRAAEDAARVARGEIDRWLLLPRLFDPTRVGVHHAGRLGPDVLPHALWDAVVLPDGVVFRCGFGATLEWADARLRVGGVLVVTTEVALTEPAESAAVPAVPARLAASGDFAGCIGRTTGLCVEGPFDVAVSDATLDRVAAADGAAPVHPHFVRRSGGTFLLPAVWALRKRAPTGPGGWAALAEALTAAGMPAV